VVRPRARIATLRDSNFMGAFSREKQSGRSP
jgi:hypothetical protein